MHVLHTCKLLSLQYTILQGSELVKWFLLPGIIHNSISSTYHMALVQPHPSSARMNDSDRLLRSLSTDVRIDVETSLSVDRNALSNIHNGIVV